MTRCARVSGNDGKLPICGRLVIDGHTTLNPAAIHAAGLDSEGAGRVGEPTRPG